MLSRASYPPEFVQACRARIDAQLSAYRALPAPGAAFDHEFFANLVLVVDVSFAHRARGQEGKNGNPMNEVRVLATSILEHDGVLTVEKSIKLDPAKSVLGTAIGGAIDLDLDAFVRLADAYFAAIEATYT